MSKILTIKPGVQPLLAGEETIIYNYLYVLLF